MSEDTGLGTQMPSPRLSALLFALSASVASAASTVPAASAGTAPPSYDLERGCAKAAAARTRDTPAFEKDFEACLSVEKGAKAKIDAGWAAWPEAAKERCVRSAEAGGTNYATIYGCVFLELDDRSARIR